MLLSESKNLTLYDYLKLSFYCRLVVQEEACECNIVKRPWGNLGKYGIVAVFIENRGIL